MEKLPVFDPTVEAKGGDRLRTEAQIFGGVARGSGGEHQV